MKPDDLKNKIKKLLSQGIFIEYLRKANGYSGEVVGVENNHVIIKSSRETFSHLVMSEKFKLIKSKGKYMLVNEKPLARPNESRLKLKDLIKECIKEELENKQHSVDQILSILYGKPGMPGQPWHEKWLEIGLNILDKGLGFGTVRAMGQADDVFKKLKRAGYSDSDIHTIRDIAVKSAYAAADQIERKYKISKANTGGNHSGQFSDEKSFSIKQFYVNNEEAADEFYELLKRLTRRKLEKEL